MKILIPKPDSWYIGTGTLRSNSVLTGPFHDSGDPWHEVNFSKDELNRFSQGARIHDQTSVYHQKVDGNFYVIPGLKRASVTTSEKRGKPVYSVPVKWRSGSTYFNSTIQSTLDLVLSNGESWTNVDNSLYHACHIARTGPYSYADAYVHTFHTGTWGESWALSASVMKIVSFTADRVKYKRSAVGAAVQPNDSGRYAAGLSLQAGIALARQLIPNEEPTGQQYDSVKYFMDGADFSMAEIRSLINKLLSPELLDDMPSLSLQSWGDLTHHATSNLDANSANMIAFVRDLKDIKSLIPKLKELGKISTHASNYLAVEYGILPTLSDLKAIWEAFSPKKYYDRQGFRRVSAYDIATNSVSIAGSDLTLQQTRRLHVAVNDRDVGLDALVEKARSIGVFPSLTNIWDLIPYSFVIDWFVDVGSVLERIDTHHRLLNLEIPYVIKSDKTEGFLSVSYPDKGFGGEITLSKYNRSVTRNVPQPRIFGEVNKPPTVQNHWIEGSALILQRTNK